MLISSCSGSYSCRSILIKKKVNFFLHKKNNMQFFIADAILSKKECPEMQKQFIIICYYLVLIWLLNNVSLAALFDQEIQKKTRLQHHLPIGTISDCILHWSDCAWLCRLLSQLYLVRMILASALLSLPAAIVHCSVYCLHQKAILLPC